MKPEDRGFSPAMIPEKSKELLLTSKVASGSHGECVSATGLLVELAQCQRAIRCLIQTTVASMDPISKQTLPSVAFTLTGLIHATEMAAHKVLDEAEALGTERDQMSKALARLEPLVPVSDGARRAWSEILECNQALSARVISIMSAMAFQDLTAQHLANATKSLEEVRERLVHILALLDLPVEAEEPAPLKVGEKIGAPTASPDGARQALADQLWAELKG